MQRRTFIAAAGASVLPLLGGGLALGTGKAMAAIPQAKLDRISIAGEPDRAVINSVYQQVNCTSKCNPQYLWIIL